jgi:uncharacterized repeat protein (TIGR03803 family)
MVRWPGFSSALVGVILVASSEAASAATVRTLYDFCSENGCTDGSAPAGGLLRDGNGNLYGTTTLGGAHGFGAVFELKRNGDSWTYQVLHSFCSSCGDSAFPQSRLVLDTAGNLYGTAPSNGELDCGAVFRLSPNADRRNWKLKRLHSFCAFDGDGAHPVAGLTYAGAMSGAPYDGVSPLYGVTIGGGANGDGAVYEIQPSDTHWKERVIYSFCPDKGSCSDGAAPQGDLMLDSAGNLYGNTFRGGAAGVGTVFKLSPRGDRWREEVLHSFCSTGDCKDGSFPEGGLAMDASGDLFGTTTGGGDGGGTLYRLAHRHGGWDETVLHSFCKGDCTDGTSPSAGPLVDADGSLFGTTDGGGAGGGTVYRLQGNTLTTLYSFCTKQDCPDGAGPMAPLITDEAGNLFGVTFIRGAHNGGTIFELSP